MKHTSMIIIAVLTLTLLATSQKAGTLKHFPVTTEITVSQPSSLEMSGYLSAVEFTSVPQATRVPVGGGPGSFLMCKGRKDCGDLKRSGKCKAGTLKTSTGRNGRVYGDCVAK
jgi:hypothetical protein